MKLWNQYELNKEIEDFTVGEDYSLDQALVKYDCLGSIAHTEMLGRAGILTAKEVGAISKELKKIIALAEKGEFRILKAEEDCHTAIENYLTKKLGEVGKKVHTARSRNDQVLTALRLYYRDRLKICQDLIRDLNKELKRFVKQYGKIKIPGYTHARRAMPSSVAIWANSFIEAMNDNLKLIGWSAELINQSPLGTGAGYGVPIEIDREYSSKLLGFGRVQENPLYVQNSRGKFESTVLHALSQIMFDLNKMSSDLITFSMPEFGYFEIPEYLCTGSSIMPHKRNPDVLELLRAKYYHMVSLESRIKTIIGNLISGYNRDFQLTKQPVMEGFDIVTRSLSIMKLVIQNLKVNEERCKTGLTPEIYATKEVYDLVKKGLPFREAYKKVSEKYAKEK